MSVRIGIGTAFGTTLSAKDYWRWAEYCEESGIDSIWHSDQLVGPGLEPLTMLAALAARTSRLKFGTNALVLPYRDPLVIAKEFATIDFLSNGRLFPVVGVGAATDPYWRATGAEPKQRGSRADEAIQLIRLLLAQAEVEFAGKHFRYAGPGLYPRPERPIPLWIGGQSEAAIHRTAALGDGWLGGLSGLPQAAAARQQIEAALEKTGRRIEPDHYGVTIPMRIGDAGDPAVASARERLGARIGANNVAEAAFAVGPPAEIIGLLRLYVAAGMSKFVMAPLVDGAEDLMAQTRLLVRDILPAVDDAHKTQGAAGA